MNTTHLIPKCARIIAALMLLALTSCMAPIAPEKLAGARRIAVVSLIGHEVSRVYIGFTVFGNEYERLDTRSWNLDATFEERIAAEVRKLGSFDAFPANADRQAFMSVYDSRIDPFDPGKAVDRNWAGIPALREVAERTKADIVLVVLSAVAQDPYGRSPQAVRGLGVYSRGLGDSTGIAVAHALIAIHALDGTTLRELNVRHLIRRRARESGGWEYLRTEVPIDKEIARTPVSKWNEQQKAQVRDLLLQITGGSWESTMQSMFNK